MYRFLEETRILLQFLLLQIFVMLALKNKCKYWVRLLKSKHANIQDKTGGKIIYRTGGILYLYRGRNYNYKDRPKFPLMLWKPVTPVYPKLIQEAPDGLTKEEAKKLRQLGEKVEPMCKLGKDMYVCVTHLWLMVPCLR